jgi:hypothetical protein
MNMTGLVAIVVAVVGLALAIVLAWAVLSGILRLMFRRVRGLVRRVMERRAASRPDAVERRHDERRER